MKKICAMVLAIMLLIGATEAFAAASSNSLLLSMSVNETYTWMVPDAKTDCMVGVWGLWGTVEGKAMKLADGSKLQLSCYSQYGDNWASKLSPDRKFAMVHTSYTSTGRYLMEYKLATQQSDSDAVDIAKHDTYSATWSTKSGRRTVTNTANTYIIDRWTSDFVQNIYYKIDIPGDISLGTYRDYVTFFAEIV